MPNMSYCIFENTSHDLIQAAERMEDLLQGEIEVSDLSSSEVRGLKNLLETVADIHTDYAEFLWEELED